MCDLFCVINAKIGQIDIQKCDIQCMNHHLALTPVHTTSTLASNYICVTLKEHARALHREHRLVIHILSQRQSYPLQAAFFRLNLILSHLITSAGNVPIRFFSASV